MPTILILDDDAADTELIRRIVTDGEYTLLTSQNLEEFHRQMMRQPIDLVVISLATISEKETPRLQHILLQAPDTKILAMAPAQRGDGLTTLLRAESLQAQHLLAKPIDPQQVLTILNMTFPQPTQQD
jgi:DNA-binding NtrC family response regulator